MTYRRATVTETSRAPPVNRREFLTLQLNEGKRVLELSCESLYMRYHDARSDAARRQVSNHEDRTAPNEPAVGFNSLTPEALFAELDRQLAEADEVRVRERDWLDGGDFGRAVGASLEAFRQRGGQVKLGSFSAPATEAAPKS